MAPCSTPRPTWLLHSPLSVNRLGVAAPDYEFARDYVSMGATGLLRGALPYLDEDEIAALVPEYLDIYAANLSSETRFCLTAWKHC